MKRFRLDELVLTSTAERRGKKVKFHPERTLVLGGNQAGKSCLLKSIYYTFGAEPAQVHEKWKSARVTSLVRFTVDGTPYGILRKQGTFLLFGPGDTLIGRFTSVTRELAPALAKLFSFKLELTQSSGASIGATPAFLFLPFYIDQDKGWVDAWSSFAKLQQFYKWKEDVASYHLGIRPNEYYQAKAKLRAAKNEVAAALAEKTLLESIQSKLSKRVTTPPFSLSLDDFRAEVEALIARANTLSVRQSDLKHLQIQQATEASTYDEQIAILTKAKEEIRKDYEYSRSIPESTVECPTCGTEYQNSIRERFAIAADEGEVTELLLQLSASRDATNKKSTELQEEYEKAASDFRDIDELLEKKRSSVRLADVIASEGHQQAKSTIQEELNAATRMAEVKIAEEREAEECLKTFSDRKRVQTIREELKATLNSFYSELDVRSISASKGFKVHSPPKSTGSELPRALLAYYLAVIHVGGKHTGRGACPLVIDSPNQQAQDEIRLEKMLSFILSHQPLDTQLVLATEQLPGDIEFLGKTIELSDRYHLLQTEEFDDSHAECSRLMEKALP